MPNFRAVYLFFVAVLFFCCPYFLPQLLSPSLEKEGNSFQKRFTKQEKKLSEKLQNLIHENEVEELSKSNYPSTFNGKSLFIFKRKKLVYWNEEATDFNTGVLLNDDPIIKTSNGWHRKIKVEKAPFTYIGLQLIQKTYSYQNQFLQNEFSASFPVKSFTELSLAKGDFKITSRKGETLFYLNAGGSKTSNLVILFCLFCFIAGVYLLLFAFPLSFSKYPFILSVFLALLLRVVSFFWLPPIFKQLKLFQEEWLAINQLIPSLGDLLLYILLFLYLFYQLKKTVRFIENKVLALGSLFLFLVFSIFSIKLISWSIEASTINYNLSNLFELNYLSFIAFICFSLLILANLLLADTCLRLLKNSFTDKTKNLLLFVYIIASVVLTFLPTFQHFIYTWGILILLFISARLNFANRQNTLSIILFLLFSGSVISYWMNYRLEIRNGVLQKNIVKKLAEERDPIAEYLFSEVQQKLRKDNLLKELSENYWLNKEKTDQYLIENYFNGYWDKYQINFSICSPVDTLLIGDESFSCFDYFQRRIRLEGDMISSNNLFQLTNFAGRIDYIGEIVYPVDSVTYRMYVDLSSVYLNENEGYPELLLDQKSRNESIDLTHYSYAVYNKNELVYKNGDFNYSTQLKISELSPETFYQYQSAEYQHLAFQKDRNVTILLSKKSYNYFDFLTSLAYLSVILSILFTIAAITLRHFPFYFQLNIYDFSTKIQLFLVGSLLSSLVLLAYGTTYYIKKQYKEKNGSALQEKIRSVNIELESKIGKEEFLSEPLKDYVSSYMIKFSNVFYSDINLYDTDGKLYSTSRPEVFIKGIKSERMNPRAFHALIKENKAQWVQNEEVGEMKYLSAYIPFKNFDNEVLGYLNLPYFSKQSELEEEISSFLVSTLNIYVGIFALTLLISVLLINQLSKPLLLIRQQIAKLKLGSSIELIDWKSKDEIGALVNEYNRIAVELNDSAEQLAKSEREVAWREMAKQVAHEIKNPLTPMKLSIQHLQRSAALKADDLEERIERTTQTLVDQIETLSNIATAFSSFAKLPSKNYMKLDVLPLVKNAIDLYSYDTPIELSINEATTTAVVEGDKDQLLRVFNNLIKNAVQATEQTEKPQLLVTVIVLDSTVEISIKDNGLGISEEQAERIFEPNFTTKSAGTGLGLAMSKSIVDQMKGRISFESVEKVGTTFKIQLPKA